MSAPRFVIVGHPNKGKSSIVATLAQNERVRIAPEPGTTTSADEYPLQLDGQTLYTLVDTPGFQRARGALAWMQDHETDAASHPAVVQRFIDEPGHGERFPDEAALLRPMLREDTGVLYVVDGSTPFGSEYEPEMEVLRWTGRPRMALINPIGRADHIDAWRDALGQYFGVVRVFNAVTAEWQKRIELLRAFGQLDESWQSAVRRAIAALEQDRDARRHQAASVISSLAVDALRLRVEKKVPSNDDPATHRDALEQDYRDRLRKLEQQARDRVEEAYDFVDLQREEEKNTGFDDALGDLFDQGTWNRFGLSSAQLALMGAGTSALVGAGADVAAHGLSFGVFTLSGAVIGGVGGWWGGARLPRTKLMGVPMGGRVAAVGPAKNVNLAFVLLGRGRLHHTLVAERTHARRDTLRLTDQVPADWGSEARRAIGGALKPVLKDPVDAAVANRAKQELSTLVAAALADHATTAGA